MRGIPLIGRAIYLSRQLCLGKQSQGNLRYVGRRLLQPLHLNTAETPGPSLASAACTHMDFHFGCFAEFANPL